jgi:acetyl esterase/lipase
MNTRKAIRWMLGTAGILLLLVLLLAGGLWWYFHPAVQRTNGVVYGQRGDHPLMMDVLAPQQPNGVGVLVLVSGGWKSDESGTFQPWMAAPVLRHGYTLFAVYHVSQPDASVMEIVEDMHRAVRFVRYHAAEYGVDPDRLGVTGGSAGGHLSLMLATRGGPGPEDAEDPVDRESSAVQAVAIFYPVTDLLNLGDSTENLGDGGPPKSFRQSFGPDAAQDLEVWQKIGRDVSPICHVSPDMPPILILHGDADTLVPLDQSLRFQQKALDAGAVIEVIEHPGGMHGWPTMVFDVRKFADWFDTYLRGENAG